MTASGPPAARCATPKAPRAASYTTTRDTARRGTPEPCPAPDRTFSLG